MVQHIHRQLALQEEVLPAEREIHRQRPLPEKTVWEDCMFWNLYIDDLTLLEVVESLEVDKNGKVVKSGWQEIMERTYSSLGVPFSQEKASSRELICEKLGALLDGKEWKVRCDHKEVIGFHLFGFVPPPGG